MRYYPIIRKIDFLSIMGDIDRINECKTETMEYAIPVKHRLTTVLIKVSKKLKDERIYQLGFVGGQNLNDS